MIDLDKIYTAIDLLTEFLVDNTDRVFEELPDVDDARATLQDFAASVRVSNAVEREQSK